MLKKMITILVALAFILVCIPVAGAEQPVVYKSTITVREDGGNYQVGFVNIEFKKDCLKPDMLPVTFDVEVNAVINENGEVEPGIEFSREVPDFCKNVHIRVDSYNGLLYNSTTGQYVQVNVKKQQIIARHFSRYAFL